MKGGVVLFIVEGPSDEAAITAFITEELRKQKIRTTVKVMYGDILTEWKGYSKSFEVTSRNVRGEVKKLISNFLSDSKIKADQIKAKDIKRVYYLTDTDNCFFQDKAHSINKKECLNKMFNFNEIEVSQSILAKFDVIFFSYNLEHVLVSENEYFTDEEKEDIAFEFATKSLEDSSHFYNTFYSDDLMKWSNYRESYTGIKKHNDRACNMNNLLDEIEEWKEN